jgi:hypothetical protein
MVDYSKWDNFDVSDDEETTRIETPKMNTDLIMKSFNQEVAALKQKSRSVRDTLVGIPSVTIRCPADPGNIRWENTTVTPDQLAMGELAPMYSKRLGLDIVVIRHRPAKESRESRFDNQPATWMMIDPVSGFASFDWQSSVGTVTIARLDGKFFDVETCGVMHEFNSYVLDAFGDSEEEAHDLMNPETFEQFFIDYENKPADLPSPYKV